MPERSSILSDRGRVSLVGISKRVRIHVQGDSMSNDAAFWGLLTFYELGYFPMRNLLNARALAALGRRWREIVGTVPIFLGGPKVLERIIELKQPRSSA